MAETKASSPPSPKKKRSPIERVIVWGLIGILFAVALWEGFARFGYQLTLDRWQDAIAAAESGDGDGALKLAEAEDMVIGFPSRSEQDAEEARKTVTFQWNSLFKRDYRIALTYGGDPPDVLGLETADAPDEEVAEPVVDPEYVETDSPPPSGPPPMHAGGRPPMHADARTQDEPPPDDGSVDAPADDAPADDAPADDAPSDGPNLGRDPDASDSDTAPMPE